MELVQKQRDVRVRKSKTEVLELDMPSSENIILVKPTCHGDVSELNRLKRTITFEVWRINNNIPYKVNYHV